MALDARLERMIRVDQAGEFGATRIYAGQMAVLGKTKDLTHMAEQEEAHLQAFNDLAIRHEVRPTVLQPIWSVLGYAIGAATALMGEKAAHACTIAVETEIESHYERQRAQLSPNHPFEADLSNLITQCQADEVAHRELAQEKGGEEAPFYSVLSGAIRVGTRAAIWLSERI